MRIAWLTILSICLISCSLTQVESTSDVVIQYITELHKESPLNFRVIVTKTQFHEDGSEKVTDTTAYASKEGKPVAFKLNSLGKKRIENLVKKGEDKGLSFSLFHENYTKNKTKNYDTRQLTLHDSPASEIVSDKDGYVLGVMGAIFETLYDTTNEATVEAFDYFPNKKVKRKTTLKLQAKEVAVKENQKFSKKMLEDSKKLIKRAFKIDTEDSSKVIVHLFEERFPQYNWQVYVNPVSYTAKSEVMAKFKYNNNYYVVLGVA